MPEQEEGLSGGGMVNSAIKQAHLAKLAKMRQEMAPRAEAIKALIARDENRYLADVVPNSLTNPEIEAEIRRMAARAKASGQQEGVLPRAERDANLSKSFKDSKVNQTVYHGTMRGDIDEFKTPAYFGSKPVANQFADPEYMYGSSKLNEGENPTVYPVRLNLKNPKVFTDFDDYEAHVMDSGLDVQRWKKQGHDGVVYAPSGDMNDPDAYFVAFEPTQIKSAIGNRGTYDVSKPDIKKAKGGKVRMTTNRDTMFMELSNKKLKRK
jgi:hypothetical protein